MTCYQCIVSPISLYNKVFTLELFQNDDDRNVRLIYYEHVLFHVRWDDFREHELAKLMMDTMSRFCNNITLFDAYKVLDILSGMGCYRPDIQA